MKVIPVKLHILLHAKAVFVFNRWYKWMIFPFSKVLKAIDFLKLYGCACGNKKDAIITACKWNHQNKNTKKSFDKLFLTRKAVTWNIIYFLT